MKLKPKQIVAAAGAIGCMTNSSFPYKVSRQLVILEKMLVDESKIVIGSQRSLVKKHGGSVGDNGLILFDDDSSRTAYADEANSLMEEEIEYDFPPRCEVGGYADDLEIKPNEIKALEPFVNFDN